MFGRIISGTALGIVGIGDLGTKAHNALETARDAVERDARLAHMHLVQHAESAEHWDGNASEDEMEFENAKREEPTVSIGDWEQNFKLVLVARQKDVSKMMISSLLAFRENSEEMYPGELADAIREDVFYIKSLILGTPAYGAAIDGLLKRSPLDIVDKEEVEALAQVRPDVKSTAVLDDALTKHAPSVPVPVIQEEEEEVQVLPLQIPKNAVGSVLGNSKTDIFMSDAEIEAAEAYLARNFESWIQLSVYLDKLMNVVY